MLYPLIRINLILWGEIFMETAIITTTSLVPALTLQIQFQSIINLIIHLFIVFLRRYVSISANRSRLIRITINYLPPMNPQILSMTDPYTFLPSSYGYDRVTINPLYAVLTVMIDHVIQTLILGAWLNQHLRPRWGNSLTD